MTDKVLRLHTEDKPGEADAKQESVGLLKGGQEGLAGNILPQLKELERARFFYPLSLFCVVVIASVLLFKNIGNQYLWQDEAQTALIAKAVVAHGLPLGYDGKNFFSQELGAEYGRGYLYTWHTWFPFYLLAGFFGLFGVSTFTARLPFAIFGLATIVLVYFVARSLWSDRKAGLVAAVLLTSSIPFLLLSRQCRYYTPMAFFVLLGLLSYVHMTREKKYSGLLFFTSFILLFQVNQIYYAILLLSVVIHAFLFHRDQFKRIFLNASVTTIPVLAWVIWVMGIPRNNPYSAQMFNLGRASQDFLEYFIETGQYIITIPMILASLLVVLVYRKKRWKLFPLPTGENFVLLVVFAGSSLLVTPLVMPFPFFRYLTPLLPVGAIILSYFVVAWARTHWLMVPVVVLLFVSSQPIADYFYEITHDYDGPMEGIVSYLNEHGTNSDTVAITYGDLPLKFYTQMRVVGGYTGEDLSTAKEAQWVIIRKNILSEKDWAVNEYLRENIPWKKFEKITIPYPDIPFENSESPMWHHYRTVVGEQPVVLYRRIKE